MDYVRDPDYARDPEKYVRAFLILQKDLINLFDYVEPAQANLGTYSFRIHELLMRVCIELEVNFKAILLENDYGKSAHLNMLDYARLDTTHRLSDYEVELPYWTGPGRVLKPFSRWAHNAPLPWFQAYNAAKHDRHANFSEANLGNLVESMCGLVALLSAQFRSEEFGPGLDLLGMGRPGPFDEAVGQYFAVKYPTTWLPQERYELTHGEVLERLQAGTLFAKLFT